MRDLEVGYIIFIWACIVIVMNLMVWEAGRILVLEEHQRVVRRLLLCLVGGFAHKIRLELCLEYLRGILAGVLGVVLQNALAGPQSAARFLQVPLVPREV